MRLLCFVMAVVLVPAGFADTITLRSGRVIQGTYLGGSPREVRVEVGNEIRNIDVSDVMRIEFGRAEAPAPMAAPPPPPAEPPAASTPPFTPLASAGPSGVIPTGTNFTVRTIDGIDSQAAHPGQTFAASLDEPVLDASGQAIIPKGAEVVLRLVDAQEAGTFTGRAGLTLNLQSVKWNGRMVEINTQSVSRVGDSRGKQTAERGGVGAVAGAALGAVFGGGKGAAEGAAVGAAAGAGSQVITKGDRVRIPPETRLTFVLDTPVQL